MQLSEVKNIINPEVLQTGEDHDIVELLLDSRKIGFFNKSLFFAISGERNNGHDYIEELYSKGVRSFVVSQKIDISRLPNSNVFLVENTIDALHKVSIAHRNKFDPKAVGITGSNGKTIIKEWLKEIVSEVDLVIASPGSFNSQIGVPLSVWNINSRHGIGIFEAGISTSGEMKKLERIIQPDFGIFTNIGGAHSNGFESITHKIQEKAQLFIGCKKVLCKYQSLEYDELIKIYGRKKIVGWGDNEKADFRIHFDNSSWSIEWEGNKESFEIPFTDKISIENAIHCICMSIILGVDRKVVKKKVQNLTSVPMRMQIKKGFANCDIIDDTYNYDLEGLKNALDFMDQNHRKSGKTLILSSFPSHFSKIDEFEEKFKDLLKDRKIEKFIAIGDGIEVLKNKPNYYEFSDTDNFISEYKNLKIENQTILVKGTRTARLEKLVSFLEEQVHGTKLEINLNSIVNNLNVFRSLIKPNTKIMAMVKAFAYGSGGSEIAQVLEYNRIDYLSVAYVDEGVQLRRDGITVPIMVLNVDESGFDQLINFNLEPEVYSLGQLKKLIEFLELNQKKLDVHLKIDSGMHRLGFVSDEIEELIEIITSCNRINIKSIFSHLATSDDSNNDDFTSNQIKEYEIICEKFESNGIKGFDKHILNTFGIIRFPESQFNMVRLGIGLYDHGINLGKPNKLKLVSKLSTTISQIKTIKKGETIGYGRRGFAEKELKIATIAIGYADGFSRQLSNGVGEVFLNGSRAKVIGVVCMDMTMIDITGLQAEIGDEVEIFGENIPVSELANKCNTISYEILTGISARVKRVFYSE